jgi:hypothetical protein
VDPTSVTESSVETSPTTEPPAFDVPVLLYVVFGLPLFMTIVWFFLQFTRKDRFGRVDRDASNTSDDANADEVPPPSAPRELPLPDERKGQ